MNEQLLNFLSEFPLFDNEKKLMAHLESFLAKEHLVRPLLVYSIQNKIAKLELKKCRSVLGKKDRLSLYSPTIVEEVMIKRDNIKNIHCMSLKVEECFYFFLNLGVKGNQFYFAIFSAPNDISTEMLRHLSQYSQSQLRVIEKLEALNKAHALIHIDDVTGLYNQRKLYKDLAMLVDKFQKEQEPFCVLFVDIDYFKKVNDMYGHLVGTRLLESVAKEIKSLLRDSDISYRYGGDEFVIILTNADATSGKIVGERILKKIKEREYNFDAKDEQKVLRLSVSIGVAEFPTDAKNSEEILSIADRMMYEAKESGRGVVFNTQDVFKTSLKKAVGEKKAL
jgi:diguanylate cyclase (GGDEF)-like protein